MGKNQSDLTEIIAQLIYLSKWKAWSLEREGYGRWVAKWHASVSSGIV